MEKIRAEKRQILILCGIMVSVLAVSNAVDRDFLPLLSQRQVKLVFAASSL